MAVIWTNEYQVHCDVGAIHKVTIDLDLDREPIFQATLNNHAGGKLEHYRALCDLGGEFPECARFGELAFRVDKDLAMKAFAALREFGTSERLCWYLVLRAATDGLGAQFIKPGQSGCSTTSIR